ncbi:MAG: ATP-binding protein [Parabacteroides sp.]|nr:ATP-binding protein [Parabacteroides sp.]
MNIQRDRYLSQIIAKKNDGMIKIITGIRRCGKSYLLNVLFRQHLMDIGVAEQNIIMLALDEDINAKYRNPLELGKYIREICANKERSFYVLLDEIQKVDSIQNTYLPDNPNEKIGFVDVLLGLKKLDNVDLYVTGSNSKMLSVDILTEFKDRGEEIRVNPLTFDEFCSAYEGESRMAWIEYMMYGGMPFVMSKKGHAEKAAYLKGLFERTYITDVIERNKLRASKDVLEDMLNYLASSVGSLTNATKLENTFKSTKNLIVSHSTISTYIDYFIDAFILKKAERYDIKGRKYIGAQQKYFFSDVGLRNARLNFRQQEENHIMENIIYNELTARGFSVDVGVVDTTVTNAEGKRQRSQLEVDFVCQRGQVRYYIQSALTVADETKRLQEINSLTKIKDSFIKIVVVKDYIIQWRDDSGILYIGIEEFLLNYINTMQ